MCLLQSGNSQFVNFGNLEKCLLGDSQNSDHDALDSTGQSPITCKITTRSLKTFKYIEYNVSICFFSTSNWFKEFWKFTVEL